MLLALGLLSVLPYALATAHGRFRPYRMEPFFPIFGVAFACYALAVWIVLRYAPTSPHQQRRWLGVIVGGAVAFNLALLPSLPTLSDDMYRYIWDGRVQGNGINPYQFASNAPKLATLRDDAIWKRMNRIDAHTIYPPFAQMIFAATWRVVGDSIVGFKLLMIGATLLGGWLLMHLLRALGESPWRALIYLWSPLLIVEVAHSAHVDALYLPLVIGAMLLRAQSWSGRVDRRVEVGIGVLLGLAALTKLYPAILAAPLWSVRDADGRRRWRLALPATMIVTLALGYALYYQPGVNLLGFLPTYGRESFNIGPLPRTLVAFTVQYRPFCATVRRIAPGLSTPCWAIPNNYGSLALIGLFSLYCWARPAATARIAVMRCVVPIGIYLLFNHNLFSWYALWLLPLIAIGLKPGRWLGFALNAWLAWGLFSGTLALSYVWFVSSSLPAWSINAQFWPVYGVLAASVASVWIGGLRSRLATWFIARKRKML
jgi:hypothetical protein